MKRRAFLASIGSTAAVGLAGCVSDSPSCNSLPDDATHAAYASRECIFVQLSDGFLNDNKPSHIPDSKLNQIRYALNLTQDIIPIDSSDLYDPDGYGPYEGFFVPGDLDKETVEDTFENRGVQLKDSWWASRSTSWSNFGNRIKERAGAATEFSASQDGIVTVPKFNLRSTGKDEDGERAKWVLYESESEATLSEIPTAFGRTSGLAVEPAEGGSPKSYEIVEHRDWVNSVDVSGSQSANGYANYEVELTINRDAIDGYLSQIDGSPDGLLLHVADGNTLHLPVPESGNGTATLIANSWADAYGIATSFMTVSRYPLFMNDEITDCTN